MGSEKTFPDDPNMQVKTLFPFCADTSIEVFEITLMKHHEQLSDPHGIGVVEYVQVLQGAMQVLVGQNWQTLAAGEGLRFHSDQYHGYRALDELVVFHNVVCYLNKTAEKQTSLSCHFDSKQHPIK